MSIKNLTVLHLVNSFVGKKGNIGIRTSKLVQFGEGVAIKSVVVCRGKDKTCDLPNIFTMGVFGHAARALNAFRIYVYNSFDHRTLDLFLFEVFVLFWMKFKLKRFAVDVIHLWDFSPRIIRSAHRKGIKVILDVAIVPQSYTKKMHLQNKALFLDFSTRHHLQERLALELSDWIIAPSDFVKSEIVSEGIEEKKIEVIPFGSDTPLCTRDFDASDEGLHYAFVGLVNNRKGIDDLLRVWDSPEFNNDKLHLCGRVYPQIKELVNKYGFKNVVFAGHINPFEYLLGCDVFVFPTWMEGSAKAVYEALAIGLPVITTPCAGSVVEDGKDGFIIPPGGGELLREKMLFFKDNKESLKIMALNAMNTGANYTWERYARLVSDRYREWNS
jgi:glycosyltransferase involved in cell wall biosynthesis